MRRMEPHDDADTKLEDLPEDVLCRIFSCLDMRDVARASASCSALLGVWATHPFLRFDADTLGLREPSLESLDLDKQQQPDRLYLQRTDDHASAFVRLVDGILLSPRGRGRGRGRGHPPPPPLEELTVSFAHLRERHGPCVDGWVRFALASTTTKRLTLDLLPHSHGRYYNPDRLCYAFPSSLLGAPAAAAALEHLFLRLASVTAVASTPMTNLATLVLAQVRVTGDDLERFLSSCHKLRSLELKCCDLLDYVKVSPAARGGAKRQLTSLTVENCWSMRSMDVSGSAIESLRLAGQNLPPSLLVGGGSSRCWCCSSSTPPPPALKVTTASFDLEYLLFPKAAASNSSSSSTNNNKKKKKTHHTHHLPPRLQLLRLAQVLPCLESLDLQNIRHGEIRLVMGRFQFQFHHLRRLDISLITLPDKYGRRPAISGGCWRDLLFIYSFLDAAPALEALSLRLMRFAPTYDKPQRPAAARPRHLRLASGGGLAHRSLRFVDITGFDADAASLDLVLYILEKAASALRSISLEPTWADVHRDRIRMALHIDLIRQAIARHIAPEVPPGSGILLLVK